MTTRELAVYTVGLCVIVLVAVWAVAGGLDWLTGR